ncbi:rod shape-determining protein MreD [Limosilactobacillus mucosae]|uniref:rod shape-determining protein MreD n=1 Tax=Limosilactobacillus mucosae TaxID=97478 RepID=UPI00233F45B3|nr:rod shape-determining protein MreD [Limosilactobacillus mucosae]MDD6454060.1 rod shape-determining protein MreD [Lactobacillus sp.]MDC2838860.1 rod shape-determining protein MreD [Limosilactobacillus mucosae]MDC2841986.1 rod shape-determining protein MreD [Limosilactobacillus mucosae]MDC2845818.1 rod shape-determining protein MreD [Limosilactobacillus mucosae]MDD6864827.1 rod shape-determining protein MreD [Lactobacillus sp.]
MYRLSRLKYVFPLGLFVALFLDGSLSKVFADFFFHYPYAMVSQLVIVWLVCAYFFEGDVQIPLMGFAVAAGIVCDLYYSGILGLFMFLYPMVVGLTKLLAKYMTPSFPIIILIFLIDLVVFELFNYWAYAAIGIAKVGLTGFLLDTLLPTLALNLVYLIVLYLPLQKLITWAADTERR